MLGGQYARCASAWIMPPLPIHPPLTPKQTLLLHTTTSPHAAHPTIVHYPNKATPCFNTKHLTNPTHVQSTMISSKIGAFIPSQLLSWKLKYETVLMVMEMVEMEMVMTTNVALPIWRGAMLPHLPRQIARSSPSATSQIKQWLLKTVSKIWFQSRWVRWCWRWCWRWWGRWWGWCWGCRWGWWRVGWANEAWCIALCQPHQCNPGFSSILAHSSSKNLPRSPFARCMKGGQIRWIVTEKCHSWCTLPTVKVLWDTEADACWGWVKSTAESKA